ncbi:hypothetical protein K2173_011385 [Erythroxylum novogranatense]|uniref:RING-type E3 ubiquitin transferase n=1 Tax=Erythroxylum novogranatense TaxID=1862640 RepID=A0AAV8S9H0_9ROSI|nr:hypothetical protein K2173_011385 [Erythroxylum novogranatense]
MDGTDFPTRLLPVDLSFIIYYSATHKFYRRTSSGRRILIREVQVESRELEFDTDSCHFENDFASNLDELRDNPEGTETTIKNEDTYVDMVEALINETRKFVFGVSEKHHYLHLCCQVAQVQEVVFEETDLFYRSIYNEADLIDQTAREAVLKLERINSHMLLTNGKGLRLESVNVGKKSRELCAICLEEIRGSTTRMICKHLFHGSGLAKWLSERNCCPCCRSELPMNRCLEL